MTDASWISGLLDTNDTTAIMALSNMEYINSCPNWEFRFIPEKDMFISRDFFVSRKNQEGFVYKLTCSDIRYVISFFKNHGLVADLISYDNKQKILKLDIGLCDD